MAYINRKMHDNNNQNEENEDTAIQIKSFLPPPHLTNKTNEK